MGNLVEVTIPVDSEAAAKLAEPGRREAVGRYVSEMLKGDRLAEMLLDALHACQQEATAAGLTEAEVDAEIAAWRAERRA